MTRTAVLDPQAPPQTFRACARPTAGAQFVDYLREGVWHIWIGFDHILFLLSLLLPAVLVLARRRAGSRCDDFRTAFWDVFRIVTVVHRGALDHAVAGGAAA